MFLAHYISFYADYNDLEALETEMPLSWGRKSIVLKDNYVSITYSASFDETIRAYNDAHYVKLAMENMSVVLFTLIDDIDSVNIIFEDCKYTVDRNYIKKAFSIRDFSELEENGNWENTIAKKLTDREFVEATFDAVFSKNDWFFKENILWTKRKFI